MRRPSSFKTLIALVACLGFILPQSVLEAGTTVSKSKTPVIIDVSLAADGSIAGQLINNQGRALKGGIVSFWQANRKVATTKADAKGAFVVRNLKGGVYRVATKDGQALVRAWPQKAAPPSAKTQLSLVAGQPIVRGQAFTSPNGPDLITLTTIGLAITGATLGAVGLHKANSAKDHLDEHIRKTH